jgi:hypothetical protein
MQRTTESAIQAAICDYLSLKGYLFSRTNNSPIFDKKQRTFRALPKYTRRGWHNICLLGFGQFYAIEVKTPDGKLSADQKGLGRRLPRQMDRRATR